MPDKPDKPAYKTLSVDYVKYRTLLTEKFKNRKVYVEQDPKKITAYIPGIIRKIYVSKDKKIREGDRLLTLEAMKMKNVIYSPMEGVVKEVHVKQGKSVAKGELLVELE